MGATSVTRTAPEPLSGRAVNLLIGPTNREYEMGALAWLIIPVAAGVLAGLWTVWAGRTRRSIGDADSLAGHERFREAMRRETPVRAGAPVAAATAARASASASGPAPISGPVAPAAQAAQVTQAAQAAPRSAQSPQPLHVRAGAVSVAPAAPVGATRVGARRGGRVPDRVPDRAAARS